MKGACLVTTRTKWEILKSFIFTLRIEFFFKFLVIRTKKRRASKLLPYKPNLLKLVLMISHCYMMYCIVSGSYLPPLHTWLVIITEYLMEGQGYKEDINTH